jgi:hypothetical protein
MSASTLHEVFALERSVIQEIEASRQRQMQFEHAALAELEQAYGLAHQEAAVAGMDLQTYAAALAEQEAAEVAEHDAAATEAEQNHAFALADAEAAAAGMDLETYAAALDQLEAAECADLEAAWASQAGTESEAHAVALAHQEAATAGLDLETYAAVLAELEAAELHAMESDQHDAETAHSLAEEEAAAAGMDLPTYVAALNEATHSEQGDEQAFLEALAYEEGMALHQAELAAGQASLAGLTPHEIAYLQQVELAHLRHAQALGLLG